MKYAEHIGRRGPFHSAFATTFAIEFAAFEELLLPQLIASGATNTLLVADGRMAAMAMTDGSLLPMQLGRDYEMVRTVPEAGLFHPKVLLQLGRKSGRLFVGSANVTALGIAGNAEAVIELECTDHPGPSQTIIRSAWHYLTRTLASESDGAARDALEWARKRTPWLAGEADDSAQTLDDGSVVAFWGGWSGMTGIGQRFVSAIGSDPVERLVIVSPYWDDTLDALSALMAGLRAGEGVVLLDPDNHIFPLHADLPGDVSFRRLPPKLKGRFAHAKIFIASTATHDHVLVGSANCTMAALGESTFGRNAEACIYRRHPRDTVVDALEIADQLEEPTLDLAQIKPQKKTPDIPLSTLSSIRPGQFEIEGLLLRWQPGRRLPDGGSIELMDVAQVTLEILEFTPYADAGDRVYRLTPDVASKAAFATVRSGDLAAATTHVTQRAILRGRRRETAGGATARALDAFSSAADFDLWVHQSFDELARADMEENEGRSETGVARPGRSRSSQPTQDHRSLTYEEFMQAKTPDRRGVGRQDSTLTGSHTDAVRSFLNMLIGIKGNEDLANDDDWLDGESEDGETDAPPTTNTPRQAEPIGPVEEPPVDVKKMTTTIATYMATSTTDGRPTSASDVLRLRLWLMLLLHKARHEKAKKGLATSADEGGWPRMAVRIISSFFVGKNPPISRLVIGSDYSEMPPDFLESWMTAISALDIASSALSHPRDAKFNARIAQLRAIVCLKIGLTNAEMESPIATAVRDGVNHAFRARILGFAKD